MLTNDWIADRLDQMAELLEAQGASRFRAQAYRKGAHTLRTLDGEVQSLVDRKGRPGIEDLPGIGRSRAGAILELLDTGGRGCWTGSWAPTPRRSHSPPFPAPVPDSPRRGKLTGLRVVRRRDECRRRLLQSGPGAP